MATTAQLSTLAVRFNSLASGLSSVHSHAGAIDQRLQRLELAFSSSTPREDEIEARLLALETTAKDFYQRSSAFDTDIDQITVGVNSQLEQFKDAMQAKIKDMLSGLSETLLENLDAHISAAAAAAAAAATTGAQQEQKTLSHTADPWLPMLPA